MILKMIDLSLMAEHLPVHKAELDKLALFICSIQDPEIKQVATEQYMIMQNHVKVMIALMNPVQNEAIGVSDLQKWEPVTFNCKQNSIGMAQENILIELKTSAETMANKNFNSGLRMKAENVRNIHIQMALQQTMILNRYSDLMNKLIKDTAPESSREEQEETVQTFKNLFNM
ncbi:hypothetical protein SAMN05216353_109110 [Halobacillus alkaliphilus]|uniref:Coat F domain-containing protein n=1 Tax=Halobacillus alkaliphilus TaxID=396056 RepID=A0A1I2LMR7_9BACI|nr:hypothetical protein [Halobacillus alkaliphilus]SFF80413.1 hypothetical protein SAMN05216353_109110 [Halobacillus alkaliphilus]